MNISLIYQLTDEPIDFWEKAHVHEVLDQYIWNNVVKRPLYVQEQTSRGLARHEAVVDFGSQYAQVTLVRFSLTEAKLNRGKNPQRFNPPIQASQNHPLQYFQ